MPHFAGLLLSVILLHPVSSILTTSQITVLGCSSGCDDEFLDAMNVSRSFVRACPPLPEVQWDDTLASFAQQRVVPSCLAEELLSDVMTDGTVAGYSAVRLNAYALRGGIPAPSTVIPDWFSAMRQRDYVWGIGGRSGCTKDACKLYPTVASSKVDSMGCSICYGPSVGYAVCAFAEVPDNEEPYVSCTPMSPQAAPPTASLSTGGRGTPSGPVTSWLSFAHALDRGPDLDPPAVIEGILAAIAGPSPSILPVMASPEGLPLGGVLRRQIVVQADRTGRANSVNVSLVNSVSPHIGPGLELAMRTPSSPLAAAVRYVSLLDSAPRNDTPETPSDSPIAPSPGPAAPQSDSSVNASITLLILLAVGVLVLCVGIVVGALMIRRAILARTRHKKGRAALEQRFDQTHSVEDMNSVSPMMFVPAPKPREGSPRDLAIKQASASAYSASGSPSASGHQWEPSAALFPYGNPAPYRARSTYNPSEASATWGHQGFDPRAAATLPSGGAQQSSRPVPPSVRWRDQDMLLPTRAG